MNTSVLKMTLLAFIIIIITGQINAAKIVQIDRKGESGHDTCLNFNDLPSNGEVRSRIVTKEVEIILKNSTNVADFFPLKVKAFNSYGVEVGESSEVYLADLDNSILQNDLLYTLFEIDINVGLFPFNLFINCEDRSAVSLDITYRVFFEGIELSSDAEIYQHPELEAGSNVDTDDISICCSEAQPLFLSSDSQSYHSYSHNLSTIEQITQQSNGLGEKRRNNSNRSLKNKDTSNVVIFPNPAFVNSTISLSIPREGGISIDILDVRGIRQKLIQLDRSFGKVQLNTEGWSAGAYYLIFSTSTGKQYRRLILLD